MRLHYDRKPPEKDAPLVVKLRRNRPALLARVLAFGFLEFLITIEYFRDKDIYGKNIDNMVL